MALDHALDHARPRPRPPSRPRKTSGPDRQEQQFSAYAELIGCPFPRDRITMFSVTRLLHIGRRICAYSRQADDFSLSAHHLCRAANLHASPPAHHSPPLMTFSELAGGAAGCAGEAAVTVGAIGLPFSPCARLFTTSNKPQYRMQPVHCRSVARRRVGPRMTAPKPQLLGGAPAPGPLLTRQSRCVHDHAQHGNRRLLPSMCGERRNRPELVRLASAGDAAMIPPLHSMRPVAYSLRRLSNASLRVSQCH